MRFVVLGIGLLAWSFSFASEWKQVESIYVDSAWAGHPVDFAMVQKAPHQYLAFYNRYQEMVVAHRQIGESKWSLKALPTKIGWDSHNSIAMAVDDSGYIHISGNMHNVPLIYFRSNKPHDATAFTKLGMTGQLESSVTYPIFLVAPSGQLYFQFRDGGSGNGNTLWNVYSTLTKQWTRVGSTGLFNGENTCNAYPANPVMGPDGLFHVLWMWRETPVANTNFHISHMKTADLQTWKSQNGQTLTLPITPQTTGVVVDPVASGKGLINMDFGLGWDSQSRPVATYHRYDGNSISQIFNARWENGTWKIYQTSKWNNFKWDLDRTGSLSHDIAAQPIVREDGRLVQRYVYRDGIRRKWILEESNLSILKDTLDAPPVSMQSLYQVQSTFPGMEVHLMQQGEWLLRWEALPINQDQPRTSYPSSSPLYLYHYQEVTVPLRDTRREFRSTSSTPNPFRLWTLKGERIP